MMAKTLSIFMILAILVGCRAYHSAHTPSTGPQPIVVEALDEKLNSIHFYTLVAHKHELAGHWTKARAARVEIDKIEQSILSHLQKNPFNRGQMIEELTQYTLISPLHAFSVHHLAWQLKLNFEVKQLTQRELEKEIAQVKITKEFQVYETNVEHLSYMMGSNARL